MRVCVCVLSYYYVYCYCISEVILLFCCGNDANTVQCIEKFTEYLQYVSEPLPHGDYGMF